MGATKAAVGVLGAADVPRVRGNHALVIEGGRQTTSGVAVLS
jgi:hypothetical protein